MILNHTIDSISGPTLITKIKVLDQIGYPNYGITPDGTCLNLITGIKIEGNKNQITLYDSQGFGKKFNRAMLVSEAWYNEPKELWKNSGYREYIENKIEWISIPTNERRTTGDINEYGGQYWITTRGEVWCDHPFLKMKLRPGSSGYLIVSTGKGDINASVHRLVAKAFIPIPERLHLLGFDYSSLIVNHKDGNKHNNHMSNLEWVTASENAIHASQSGFTTKIPDDTLIKIFEMLSAGKRNQDISKELDIPLLTIDSIRKRTTRRYNPSNYTWPVSNEISEGISERHLQIIEDFNNGMKYKDLSDKYKSSHETIRNILRDNINLVDKTKCEILGNRVEQVSSEKLEEIFKLLEQGKNNVEIARTVGVGKNKVNAIRTRRLYAKESRGRKWGLPEKQQKQKERDRIIIDLHNRGMTRRMIHKETGVPETTITRILTQNGFYN